MDAHPQRRSECFDDDGRLKRTGTMWTASAHMITALLGSGVLSLVWATAQLGWIIGPTVILLFSFVTYYSSTLLSACYRSGDLVVGKRNYTYMDVVRSNLGNIKFKIYGLLYYVNVFGVLIDYTRTSSASLNAIHRSTRFHNLNPEMTVFGIIQIIISSLITDFKLLWWLSFITAPMSFTYAGIGLGLSIAKVAENGKFGGNLTGISIGTVTGAEKIWRSFKAVCIIECAYSYFQVLFEIQDTIKSSPPESKTMNKASLISMGVTTLFYILFGCFGYAAFGDLSPENLFAGFCFHNPHWLLDIANAAIAVHRIGAYQVYCQPLFAFVEKQTAERFPDCQFITQEIKVPLPGFRPYKLNRFRFVWRTIFVILTTVIPMILPFSKDAVGLLGALGFWLFTVYFPVGMYIVQKKIRKWSSKWLCLQTLSLCCLVLTIAAAAGSIAKIVLDPNSFMPFKTITEQPVTYCSTS